MLDHLASKGKFAEALGQMEMGLNEGLVGRAFESKNIEFEANLQASDPKRKDQAKTHNVHGAYALFRDGAVWEFGARTVMDDVPTESSGFGGSTGALQTTANAVHAVAKLRMKSKKRLDAEAGGA